MLTDGRTHTAIIVQTCGLCNLKLHPVYIIPHFHKLYEVALYGGVSLDTLTNSDDYHVRVANLRFNRNENALRIKVGYLKKSHVSQIVTEYAEFCEL